MLVVRELPPDSSSIVCSSRWVRRVRVRFSGFQKMVHISEEHNLNLS